MRKLIGWQSQSDWKGGRKQNPLGCYSPILVKMVRESGRMARVCRKQISKFGDCPGQVLCRPKRPTACLKLTLIRPVGNRKYRGMI